MKRIALILVSLVAMLTVGFAGCTPVNYQLSTSGTPSNGGTVSPSGGTYKQGAEVTLLATPANYYRFNGWVGDISGTTNPITLKINSNKNVVASFVKIQYSLQLNLNSPGSGTLDPASGNYDAGNQIKVTATPATGYRFDHWGGSASGTTNPLNIVMDNNKTIIGYFIQQYSLKISSNPANAGTITPGNGIYDAGKVTITAASVFPYAFNNWSGTDNDNINPTTVTMSADKSVNAYFKQLSPGVPQTLSGNYSQGSGITIVNLKLIAGQWVQGQLGDQMTADVQIVDASNNVVKNLGSVSNTNFTFQAPSSGSYSIKISTHSMLFDNYSLTYTVYS
jgi:hypothetical protein